VKLGQGIREGWGEGDFKIWCYFSLSYSDLISDELNSLFSQVPSVFSMTVNGELSLPALILTHEHFIIFFFPLPS